MQAEWDPRSVEGGSDELDRLDHTIREAKKAASEAARAAPFGIDDDDLPRAEPYRRDDEQGPSDG